MTTKAFQYIVLIGRSGIHGVPKTLQTVIDYLKSKNITICIEEKTAPLLTNNQLPIFPGDNLPKDADLIIVVGGDGSLLNAAHIAIAADLPVLGINRGRLGFLTDIYPDELDKIGEVLRGQYQHEHRFLISASIQCQEKIEHTDIALNDVVLNLGDAPQMIEFETYINNRLVCSQRADGLIISTPTGSTAYALSGGGPILYPSLNALVLVPMLPHTLSSRPIVVEADTAVEVRVSSSNEYAPYLSCDGQKRVRVSPGASITIHKAKKQLRLIHPHDYSYFSTLREKLGWERHFTRKA